jgi:hypothetical protein
MSRGDAEHEPGARPEQQGDSLPAVIPGGWALDTYVPRPLSRRSARLAALRRRRRTTVFAVLTAAVLVLVVGVLVVPMLSGRASQVTSAATNPAVAAPVDQVAQGMDPEVLLLVTRDDQPEAPARSITLLATSDAGRAAVVFVPTGLLLDLPGIGLDRVAVAQHYEDVSLVEQTLSAELDLEIDAAVSLDERGLAGLLGAAGELSVDVGADELVAAEGESEPAVFEPGEQALDGEELARYWVLAAEGERGLSELARQEQVLTALLQRVADDPDVLDRALMVGVDPESSAGPDDLRDMLRRLAEALGDDRLAFGVLPVVEFGGSGESGRTTYRPGEEAQATVTSLLGQAGDEAQVTRVDVLTRGDGYAERTADANQVEEALGEGFQVFLAPGEPDADQTRIVVHDDSSQTRAQAEAVREALGVGTIAVDEQPQSVADVTVVLGEDFPAGASTGDENTEQDT